MVHIFTILYLFFWKNKNKYKTKQDTKKLIENFIIGLFDSQMIYLVQANSLKKQLCVVRGSGFIYAHMSR